MNHRFMNMKSLLKSEIVILIIMLLGLSLIACSKRNSAKESEKPVNQTGTVEELPQEDITSVSGTLEEPTSGKDTQEEQDSITKQESVTEEPVTLQSLLADSNARRMEMPDFTPDASEYAKEPEVKEFTEEEINQLLYPDNFLYDIKTKSDALEDIDYLFQIFKGSYGGYRYFGGDEVFDQAKQNIINEVNSLEGDSVAFENYFKILFKNLNFITDSHFFLGYGNIGYEKYYYTDSESREIRKDSEGYYFYKDNKKLYLRSDIIPYLKFTLTDSGEIVYGIFALATREGAKFLPDTLKLTEGEEKLEWNEVNPGQVIGNYVSTSGEVSFPELKKFDPVYNLLTIDGIPLAQLQSFDVTNTDAVNRFIDDAKELRNKEAVVIDLRDNPGGSPELATAWLYNLTGEWVYDKCKDIQRYSTLNQFILSDYSEKINIRQIYSNIDFMNEHPEFLEEQLKQEKYAPGETGISSPDAKWVQHDGITFILYNKGSASASECLIGAAQSMENVLLVGSNSSGCCITGGVNATNPVYLPKSKIKLFYCQILHLTSDQKDFDAAGFIPDIIVRNGNAEEKIAACYHYYYDNDAQD